MIQSACSSVFAIARDCSADEAPVQSIWDVYMHDRGGFVKAKNYDGAKLKPDYVIRTPSIIGEATTTIVIFYGSYINIFPFDNYLVEFEEN